ncbi:MAG: hypothetical protein HKN95_06285 [Acidimicrobiia bacterium]|nr:hypothetical protein [Acidimicrobiia bacterium]
MARRLVWLKWRLLVNGVRHDKQRAIGLPLVLTLIIWGGWTLSRGYGSAAESMEGVARGEYSIWVVALLWILWTTVPVVVFPLDETLDPNRFSLLPFERRQLLGGLLSAGLVTPPIIIPLMILTVTAFIFGGWFATPVAVLAGALILAILIVSGQAFTAVVSSLVRSRRGRDLIMVIIAGLGLAGFLMQRSIANAIGEYGLVGAVQEFPLSPYRFLLPPAGAQYAVVSADAGNVLGTVSGLLISAAWLGALLAFWHWIVQRLLTTPEVTSVSRRSFGRGFAERFGWSTVLIVARKELRYYLREPRMRMVWTGAVIFLGFLVAATLFGDAQLARVKEQEWMPLLAPIVVLFVGLPIALNQFGWERRAASFLFALPASPLQVIVGKNLATGFGLMLEATAVSIAFSFYVDSAQYLPLLPPLMLTAVLAQMAVGNVVSAVTPLRLPDPGTDVFSQASEQGCLAIGSQLIAFFVIGLSLVIPASAMTIALFYTDVLSPQLIAWLSVVWGLLLYGLGLVVSTWVTRRRLPEILAWVEV